MSASNIKIWSTVSYLSQCLGFVSNALSAIFNFIAKLARVSKSTGKTMGIAGLLISCLGLIANTIATVANPNISKREKIRAVIVLIIGLSLSIPAFYLTLTYPAAALVIGLSLLGFWVVNSLFSFGSNIYQTYQLKKKYRKNPGYLVEKYKEKLNTLEDKIKKAQQNDERDKQEKLFLLLCELKSKLKYAEAHGAQALYEKELAIKRKERIACYIDFTLATTGLLLGILGIGIMPVMPVLGPLMIVLSIVNLTITLIKSGIEIHDNIKKSQKTAKKLDKMFSSQDKKHENKHDVEPTYNYIQSRLSEKTNPSSSYVNYIVNEQDKNKDKYLETSPKTEEFNIKRNESCLSLN
ncbi:hypothetical protein [Legionella israelensis]|uniref:Uncharacterized protein n=1 Tax=Legionella israelensis TaxID=454 RepID=A0A0W0WDS9_9GAMM|nr:hypothetical protein [Legionella israelensis]KTD30532.1 hypothetical protein Lisr_0714 [Legionella israelensis]QBS10286.1 hypothetical protein E4T55_10705 [Legionella israelensis]SCY39157.1 hypothetical protein SAMN02746069_02280 [Legionella israelensis DSM 19235]STX59886.1 Uncharacterised protein [Legionella israelensis]